MCPHLFVCVELARIAHAKKVIQTIEGTKRWRDFLLWKCRDKILIYELFLFFICPHFLVFVSLFFLLWVLGMTLNHSQTIIRHLYFFFGVRIYIFYTEVSARNSCDPVSSDPSQNRSYVTPNTLLWFSAEVPSESL